MVRVAVRDDDLLQIPDVESELLDRSDDAVFALRDTSVDESQRASRAVEGVAVVEQVRVYRAQVDSPEPFKDLVGGCHSGSVVSLSGRAVHGSRQPFEMPCSSRCNHARAIRQSRATVSGET